MYNIFRIKKAHRAILPSHPLSAELLDCRSCVGWSLLMLCKMCMSFAFEFSFCEIIYLEGNRKLWFLVFIFVIHAMCMCPSAPLLFVQRFTKFKNHKTFFHVHVNDYIKYSFDHHVFEYFIMDAALTWVQANDISWQRVCRIRIP